MKRLNSSVKVMFWGMLVSFLGSLPLGTMNIMATGISVSRGVFDAFMYSAGSCLVEILYVRIILALMEKVFRYKKIFRTMGLLTAFILLFLATNSFIAAIHMTGFKSALPVNMDYPFLSGLIISSVNPLHFVFWIGWSTVLMNKQILKAGLWQYNFYIIGISLGTMLGFACYIYGGNYLITRWKSDQNLINWCVGSFLLVTAVIQFYKISVVRRNKTA